MPMISRKPAAARRIRISATTALVLAAGVAYVAAIAIGYVREIGVIGLVGWILIAAWDIRWTVKRNNRGRRTAYRFYPPSGNPKPRDPS